jgi:hypothetical protein
VVLQILHFDLSEAWPLTKRIPVLWTGSSVNSLDVFSEGMGTLL